MSKKENKESVGLGDSIEKITKATGIKKITEFFFGKDCKCEERKEALNRQFRYKKPECLVAKEYKYLEGFFTEGNEVVTKKQQSELIAISNRVFSEQKKTSSCGSCVKKMVRDLRVIYNEYNK